MKILILNWRCPKNPKSGGAEIVTMQHAKGWVKRGHVVTWVASSYELDTRQSNIPDQEMMDGVKFIHLGGLGLLHIRVAMYLLEHSKEYDVIVDEIHGIPFFAPLFTTTPVVAFIHEVADEIWDYMYPFPINKLGRFLESLYFVVYKKCAFWTDAPSTINELVERGIPRKNCVAIPCPITKQKQENGKRKTEDRSLKEKNPTFIFVSRVVRMKGIEEVIKAFAFIHKEKPTSKLWIVGHGEKKYITSLKQMVSEYVIQDSVVFFDTVSEQKKYDLMTRAHVLLHASVKEGWGLVVLEAASVGTPSIVYNVPGLRDVVHSGATGIVITQNNPAILATNAIKLMNDRGQYALFQTVGRTWVHSLHWDDAVRESEKLLTHHC